MRAGLKVHGPFKQDNVRGGWTAKCMSCKESVYGYEDDDSDGFKRFIGWFHTGLKNSTDHCPRAKVVPDPANLGASINAY